MNTSNQHNVKKSESRIMHFLGSSRSLTWISFSSAFLFLVFGVLSLNQFHPRLAIVGISLTMIGIAESLLIAPMILKRFRKSVFVLEYALRHISKGEFIEQIEVESKDLQASSIHLSELQQSMKQAAQFSYSIGKGDFAVELVSSGEKDVLNNSLLTMRDQLKKVAEEDNRRNWVTSGIAQLGEILRSHESAEDLYDRIITFVVKYTGSNQGGLFIVREENREKFLELASMYAFERKKFQTKRIQIGEGLVGRAFLEMDSIFLTEVPDNYVNITSGLGGASPKSIFIMPLVVNEEVQGVLELASFTLYSEYYLDFVKRSAESMASVISNMKITERTSQLLKQSQEQTEMLRAQEEEVRQNLEEMTATQEELARKTHAIEEASMESKCILHAIDSTMATIEFSPEGKVLDANDNFLHVMKCSLEEIQGKHHREFVPQEILASEQYATFWTNLTEKRAHYPHIVFEHLKGKPSLRLMEDYLHARKADLVVITTKGKNIFERIVSGSFSREMICHSHFPMLVYHIHDHSIG